MGRIVEQGTVVDRKQERTARLWAYNKRIGIPGLLKAFFSHCQNRYEIAEYLGVSEDTLAEALEYYRQIYGASVSSGNYVVQFEPFLSVYEICLFPREETRNGDILV